MNVVEKRKKKNRWSRKWQNCLPLSVKHGSSMTWLSRESAVRRAVIHTWENCPTISP